MVPILEASDMESWVFFVHTQKLSAERWNLKWNSHQNLGEIFTALNLRLQRQFPTSISFVSILLSSCHALLGTAHCKVVFKDQYPLDISIASYRRSRPGSLFLNSYKKPIVWSSAHALSGNVVSAKSYSGLFSKKKKKDCRAIGEPPHCPSF